MALKRERFLSKGQLFQDMQRFMGKLFDSVPRRFFNPLAAMAGAGSQQQFYAECLITINSLFSQDAQFSRDDLKDAIVALILAEHIESIDTPESADPAFEDAVSRQKNAGRQSRGAGKQAHAAGRFQKGGGESQEEKGQSREEAMASRVISYLADEEVGWLEEGIDSQTYSRTYMITEQGMLLAEYLQRASSMKLDEMSNYLYNSYLAIDDFSRHKKERENNNPYTLVIVNAYNNIRSLNSSLKILRRSIKRIVRKVTGKLTFEQLMDNLGDYIDGDFIGEFTRLVDSENASLFRGPITAMLRKLMRSEETRDVFVRDCMKANKDERLTYEQAEIRIDEQVTFIEDFLSDGYPAMVRDIRNQMVEYIMIVRLKLKMTMDIAEGSQEVLGRFIKKLSEMPAGQETPEEMLAAFRILENGYISPGSVKSGVRKRGKLKNAAQRQTVLSAEEIQEEQDKIRRMRDVPYTKEKMKAYGDRYKIGGMIRASDLPLETKEEVLSDVAAASFASANGMDVTVDEDYLETKEVRLRDFTMKEEAKDAETVPDQKD